jgi:hypothetical protein
MWPSGYPLGERGYPNWVTSLRIPRAKLAHCTRRKLPVLDSQQELYRTTLRRVIELKGGPALADYLRVRPSILYGWLGGVLLIPQPVFFQIVEILEEDARVLKPTAKKSSSSTEPKP